MGRKAKNPEPPSPAAIALGGRIRTLMREKNISLEEVASRLGFQQTTIRKIWAGDNVRQYIQFAELAKAIGVTPNELLGDDAPSLDAGLVAGAVQGVIEQLGHDRRTARAASEIALLCAKEHRVLDEDAATEVRVKAKLQLEQFLRPKQN